MKKGDFIMKNSIKKVFFTSILISGVALFGLMLFPTKKIEVSEKSSTSVEVAAIPGREDAIFIY